jgi:hypothetical protein
MKQMMMARVTCSNFDEAGNAADALRDAGYAVYITDEVDVDSPAVFMEVRCMHDDAVKVLHQISRIIEPDNGFCVDAGPDDGRRIWGH